MGEFPYVIINRHLTAQQVQLLGSLRVAKVLRDCRKTLQLTQGKMHKNPLLH